MKKVLQYFSLNEQSKPVSTSLVSHFNLSASLSLSTNEEEKYMLQVSYSNGIASLMYVIVCTKPNISQVVNIVSRYMHKLGKRHLSCEMVLGYILDTIDVGLVFRQDEKLVINYIDSDYVGDLNKLRSATNYAFTFDKRHISWKSTSQPTMTLSTIEIKYMVVDEDIK